jgi:cardiolipin synthase C
MSSREQADRGLCFALRLCCRGVPSMVTVRSCNPILSAPGTYGALHAAADRVASQLSAADESAFWLLDRNERAWLARLALTDEAVSTLDIQYFIWQPDATGYLLLRRVLQAADRGVRVRLLLDDFALLGMDSLLAGIDAHPSVEVRVYNPWRRRAVIARPFELLFRFGELNSRMHNKVYAADDRFAIIGGRNIGDRYFGLHDGFIQNDLDLMSVGPATDRHSRKLRGLLDQQRDVSGFLPGRE